MSRERRRGKKEPKDKILEDITLMISWKPLVGKCLHCVKEPINGVEKNAVAVVCTNSLCKEEVIDHVSIPAPLRFGYLCNWETRQPWS